MSLGIFRKYEKSVELGFQGTTKNFFKIFFLYFPCSFCNTSCSSLLREQLFFLHATVHPILVNSLVCIFQVRSGDTAHGATRALRVQSF